MVGQRAPGFLRTKARQAGMGKMSKKKETRHSTKKCPDCGNDRLVLLYSQNKKLCSNGKCGAEIPWYLDPGQKPIAG